MRRPQAQHAAQLLALFALLGVFACDRVTPVAPVNSTITISVNPSRIDAAGEATITIIVRKEDGTPVNPGTQVNVSTTLGQVDPDVAFTDETGVAKSTLIGDGRIGMATVSATTGAAALVSVDVQVGSLAASITLTASKTDISKDPPAEGEVLGLLALVRDDTGAPLGGVTVNFATDTGSLGSGGAAIVTNELGEARDTLTITRNNLLVLAAPSFLVFAQTAIEGGTLTEDSVEIFIADIPVTLSFQPNPTSVFDIGGEIVLAAQVGDNLGDPLPGVLVSFFTAVGELASGGVPQETNASGRAEDKLTVSEAQLGALGSTSFQVRAEAAGFGGNVLVETFSIQVVSDIPTASFTFVQSGSVVDFTYIGNCACTISFEWDFDTVAGATVDSREENPRHTYLTPGPKTVQLVVKNPDGDSTSESSSLIVP